MKVRPKRMGPTPKVVLTAEEEFVMSRIDGNLTVRDLVGLTGLELARVEQIVTKLASQGAVALEDAESSQRLPEVLSDPHLPGDEETASLADFAASLGMDPSAFAATETKAVLERPVSESRVGSKSSYPPPPMEAEKLEVLAAHVEEDIPTLDPDIHGVPEDEENEPLPEGERSEEVVTVAEGEQDTAAQERNYRQIYMERFHILTSDARVAAAHSASGAELFALCLDPDPKVIAAILENHTTGLDHVRMIAFHHRTGTGLELLSRRQEWLRDLQVERRLIRNPQCGEATLSRVMNPKNLLSTYKIMVDREVPELSRVRVRGHFRKKWTMGTPEDRADLIMRTEGRPLIYMTGCTFDARTTQIICGKTVTSLLLVQSFAKFPATPPAILAHFMKQNFVRKNPGIKKMLLAHPNMPGDIKRSV